MSWLGAFLVGCFQAFAILPGISRSGSTILGGRLMGLKNDDSVTFSFLLAIPAILGATVLTLRDLWENHQAGLPVAHSPMELLARGGDLVCRRDRLAAVADRLEPARPAPLVRLVVHSSGDVGHRPFRDGSSGNPTHNYYGHVFSI